MKRLLFNFLFIFVLLMRGMASPCDIDTVYNCDFEGDVSEWIFARAKGIHTGFAIGEAKSYRGSKSLYISPDGGKSTGYDQDNDSGYVSVAYTKINMTEGEYILSYYSYYELQYLDIDYDYCQMAIVPASNSIEPLNHYERYPDFLDKYVISRTMSGNYSSWSSMSHNFTISQAGDYYIVCAFIATDTITNEIGAGIDNIKITRRNEITYKETLEGVLVEWTGAYPEYRIRWESNCQGYHYDTVTTNQYLIPFTLLRDAVYNSSTQEIEITPVCDDGKSGTTFSSYLRVTTNIFPKDTCPAVPSIRAENTAQGVRASWKGNTERYDFKYGQASYGCSWIDTINSITDTTYLLPYDPFEEDTYYFFVRGICDNDTSIWQRVSLFVQAADACSSDACAAKPCELYAQNTAEGIQLSWKGNASQYEIECRSEDEYYRRGNIYRYNDSNYVRMIATDEIYTIPYNTLADTLYHFRVRAICEQDTSYWTEYISAYNINFGEYCIPFYDLCGPHTVCTYGGFHSPYNNKKTLDYRQKDWRDSYNSHDGYRYGINGSYTYRSRHTICFEGETDPRCDNELSTVPPGEKYSMRLGNCYVGEGESVTYTHTIDSGYPLVLLLKYAVVLQDPSHDPSENPHFTLEILDENNKLIDSECLYADFAADKNAEGWHNAVNAHEPTSEEYRNVVWKDWTTIGVNLSDLAEFGDRTIKIRLTTKDCTRGMHYGYAYFTLQCTTGDMEGMHCGERPIKFEVAEGFKYRWYIMGDSTKTMVSDSNVFYVQPQDTNSYHVDMISLENEDCFYTLDAYTLPRLPRPEATFEHTPHDCINEMTIHNDSYVYKIMLDGSHQADGYVVIDSIVWDFGKYGTSTEISPKVVVPNEGDTFDVSLRVVAMDCPEVATYTMYVPAIKPIVTHTYVGICEGDTLLYNGKTYTGPAEELVEETKGVNGCDSTSYLVVHYLDPKPTDIYDTICTAMLPYDFYGKACYESGIYEDTLIAKGGCDSVYYRLHLAVFDALDIKINTTPEACMDDISYDLPYTVLAGETTGYTIHYSDKAQDQGFVDESGMTDSSGTLTLRMPQNARPDIYTGEVAFDNHGCEAHKVPFSVSVRYSSDVIIQRWNDVLAVRQSAYDQYEGFTAYQWYCDGVAIHGATNPTYYKPEKLQGHTYSVELTRAKDGFKTNSCAYLPTQEPDSTTLVVEPTATQPKAVMQVTAPESGTMMLISNMGYIIDQVLATEGINGIVAPEEAGIYMICLLSQSGNKYVQKIIVY